MIRLGLGSETESVDSQPMMTLSIRIGYSCDDGRDSTAQLNVFAAPNRKMRPTLMRSKDTAMASYLSDGGSLFDDGLRLDSDELVIRYQNDLQSHLNMNDTDQSGISQIDAIVQLSS